MKKKIFLANLLYRYFVKKYRKIIEKHFSMSKNLFRVAILVILSHRTKEEIIIKKDEFLFKKLKLDLDKFLKLDEKKISRLIKPVGFYNRKAKKIKKFCEILKEKYHGKIPLNREELLKLPGIGEKSADVILNAAGISVIAIDTHVKVISKRLGLTNKEKYKEIQKDLHKLFPEDKRKIINLGFVLFGKEICKTKNPKCELCPFKRYCKYYKYYK